MLTYCVQAAWPGRLEVTQERRDTSSQLLILHRGLSSGGWLCPTSQGCLLCPSENRPDCDLFASSLFCLGVARSSRFTQLVGLLWGVMSPLFQCSGCPEELRPIAVLS